ERLALGVAVEVDARAIGQCGELLVQRHDLDIVPGASILARRRRRRGGAPCSGSLVTIGGCRHDPSAFLLHPHRSGSDCPQARWGLTSRPATAVNTKASGPTGGVQT